MEANQTANRRRKSDNLPKPVLNLARRVNQRVAKADGCYAFRIVVLDGVWYVGFGDGEHGLERLG